MIELKKIGKGGFSGCYLNQNQKDYVYKVFNKESTKFSADMVNNEIEIYNKINNQSDFIIKYYGSNTSKSHISLKLEKCHTDLSNFKKIIQIDDVDVNRILWCTLQGLNVLHDNNIIHCDIKPNNLLLKFDQSGNYIVKICDFGLSQQDSGHSQYIKGTELYIDPATVRGNIICQRSDMWALGVTLLLFYVPTSSLKFLKTKELKQDPHIITDNLQKIIKLVPNSFIRFSIEKCLQFDYRKRITSQQLLAIMDQAVKQTDIVIDFLYNKQQIFTDYLKIVHIASNKQINYVMFDHGYQCFYIKQHQQNITFNKETGEIYTYPILNEKQFEALIPCLSQLSKKYSINGQYKLTATESPRLSNFKQQKNFILFTYRDRNNVYNYKYDTIETKTIIINNMNTIEISQQYVINMPTSKYK